MSRYISSEEAQAISQAMEEKAQLCQQVMRHAKVTGIHLIEWFGSRGCPNCNHENEISANFCGQCGTEI